MGRLTDIGLRLGTDKAEHHFFTEFYEDFFAPFLSPNVLEIGILDGASLKMYHEYFNGKARIFGVDKNEKSGMFLNHPTIKTIQGDILLESTIEKCKKAVGEAKYDIIIDDGGHTMEEQQKSLLKLWDSLKPGGLFIVEDLHTSGMLDFNPDRTTSTLAILQGLQKDEYLDSKYLTVDDLKRINSEIHDLMVWDNSVPQNGPLAGRMSITSIIFKKTAEQMEASKQTPTVEEKKPETPATEEFKRPSTVTTSETKTVENPVKPEPDTAKTEHKPETLRSDKNLLNDFFQFVKTNATHTKLINIAALDNAITDFTNQNK